MQFRYTDRYGNFAVPVRVVFVGDDGGRCISGVFRWDFGLVLSKVFCCMCSPVEHCFCFYLIFFLYEYENVPRRSGFRRCDR